MVSRRDTFPKDVCSIDCTHNYDNNPALYRVGKSTLNRVRNKLQNEGGQRDIFIPTEDLKLAQLQEIKESIW